MAKMLKFNIKNLKYALPDASGSYENSEIKAIGGAQSLTLEAQFSQQDIYADGRVAYSIASDKGLNGTLEIVDLDEQYEIDMGRKIKLASGIADVEQKKNQEHAIYFEVDGIDDQNKRLTIKTWLYGVNSGKPNESYEQDGDSGINHQVYSIPLSIFGTLLMDADGMNPYVDENGNTLMTWKYSSKPGDADFETFGDTVPVPKVAAEG